MKQSKTTMKLTKVSVERLPAMDARYNRFDNEIKGFAVRVSATGDKAFTTSTGPVKAARGR